MRETLVANLNPRSFLSWPVILVSFTWSISTNLMDRFHNPEGHYLERIFALVAGHAVLFLALGVLVRTLRPLSAQFQSALMVPVVVFVSCLRGITVWQIMMGFGFDTMDLFVYRAFGSITNLGLPLTLVAIAVERFRSFSRSASRLKHDADLLLDLRARAQNQIQEDARKRLEGIRQAVLGALEGLSVVSTANLSQELNRVLDQVVRPLSHQMDSEQEETHRATLETEAKIDWRKAIREALSPGFLSPIGVSFLFTLVSIVFLFVTFDIPEALTLLLIVGVGSFLVVSLLKISLLTLSAKYEGFPVAVAVVFGLVTGGLLHGSATLFVTHDADNPTLLIPVVIYLLSGISILLAIAGSAQFQAKRIISELEAVTSELAWEIARITEEQRQIRRKLVGLLHGKLQTAFMSALLRLRSSESISSVKDLSEEDILTFLRKEVLAAELQMNPTPRSLDAIVEEVRATWDGIAKVSLSGGDLSPRIESDAQLMTSLNDLFVELTFNSIKHGMATKVQFKLELLSEDKVALTCTDNGQSREKAGATGLGTSLLNDCSLEWRRESSVSGTETHLVLPFLPA